MLNCRKLVGVIAGTILVILVGLTAVPQSRSKVRSRRGASQQGVAKAGAVQGPQGLNPDSAWTRLAESYIALGKRPHEFGNPLPLPVKRIDGNGTTCNNNTDCHLRDGCLADSVGVCYTPPRKLLLNTLGRSNTEKKGASLQLTCRWMPDKGDQVPPLNLGRPEGSIRTPEEQVQDFKHFTGIFFDKWYDWKADIKEIRSGEINDNFETSGRHEGEDLLYKIKNFCVSAAGTGIQGWWPANETTRHTAPVLQRYRGGDDLFQVGPDISTTQASTNSFLRGPSREGPPLRLATKPLWYVDRKLVFMMMQRDSHRSFALSKASSLIYNVESGFPRATSNATGEQGVANNAPTATDAPVAEDEARHDVTSVYIHYHMVAHPTAVAMGTSSWLRETRSFRDTSFQRSLSLAATTHMTIFNRLQDAVFSYEKRRTELGMPELTPREREEAERLLQTPICFKEAVFYQSCHEIDCVANPQDIPSGRNSFPMWGVKNPKTQRAVANRFRNCAGAPLLPLRRVTVSAPTVLYPYRSWGTKAVMAQTSFVEQLYTAVSNFHPNAILHVEEMTGLTIPQMIRLYSASDIVLGTYSSGFMYVFLCAPGSIGVVIEWKGMAWHERFGGLDRNPRSDYGTTYTAGKGHHMVLAFPGSIGRVPSKQLAAPHFAVLEGLQRAMKLRTRPQGIFDTPLSSQEWGDRWAALRNETGLTESELRKWTEPMAWDTGGLLLQREIRTTLHPEFLAEGTCHRMLQYFRDAPRIARRMYPVRQNIERRDVLILFPLCRGDPSVRTPSFLRAALKTELQFLRNHLSRRTNVLLGLDASSCEEGEISERVSDLNLEALMTSLVPSKEPPWTPHDAWTSTVGTLLSASCRNRDIQNSTPVAPPGQPVDLFLGDKLWVQEALSRQPRSTRRTTSPRMHIRSSCDWTLRFQDGNGLRSEFSALGKKSLL